MSAGGPLEALTSIKARLGALVGVSVVVAAVVATVGGDAGVPAWLALPITVALALAVTQLLAVGVTSPLREMTHAATRMARGDYAVRVRADSADEVGELARAFNRMADDLGRVDQQRRDLVATVSHELRTPLTGLIAVLENLQDGVATRGDGLQTALDQAERLSALVRDLLDLSRLEAGAVGLRRAAVPVRELLERAVAEAFALPREAAYDVRVEPADLVVDADPDRLHQLVANLLDNASRHCPAGGVVGVRATAGAGSLDWVLEVSNPGAGIAPTDRARIFERFGSLSDPSGGGTGLGLAIARWVTDLHGGSIGAVDPPPGVDGARLRAVLPRRGPTSHPHTTEPSQTTRPIPVKEAPVAQTAPPPAPTTPSAPSAPSTTGVPGLPPGPGVPGMLSWPTGTAPARPWLLAASAAVGVLAALLVVENQPGLGYALVLLAGGGVVYAASADRRDPFTLTCAALCVALVLVLVLRDALWIGVLCTLAATVLVVVGSTRARSLLGMVLSGVTWPLSALFGLPWLGRTIRAVGGAGRALPVARTVVLSLLGLSVFALLFSSADAVFADWLDVVVPDLGVDGAVVRVFVALAIGGVVLATAYFALNPPQVEPDQAPARRPTRQRYEWLAPVLVVDAVFVVFLLAQATAVFGGRDYVEQATGLTYADYVHQGFGQLTFATVLTVLVVSVAGRKAALETAADRAWLRGSLGLLCVLTLLVVGSALHRLDLYTEAYGLTRLRLLAGTFELWLGLVVLGLMVAGVGLRGAWLTQAGVLSGAGALLVLALASPDALVARTAVDRFAETGRIDLVYLDGLSADATPALLRLPPAVRRCALTQRAFSTRADDSRWEWNLGRHREGDLSAVRALPAVDCGDRS